MVEGINTSSIQNVSVRHAARGVSSSLPVEPVEASRASDFVKSAIYVDNLQNVAILEYRSSESGEVVRQYPTKGQIEAFKRAEQLQQKVAERFAQESAAVVSAPSAEAPSVAVTSSAPAPAPASPAPSVEAAPSPGAEAAPVDSSVTSVLA